MNDSETPKLPGEIQPDPAREALKEPRFTAEELQNEIGDSEPWDEDTVEADPEPAQPKEPDTVTDFLH